MLECVWVKVEGGVSKGWSVCGCRVEGDVGAGNS